MPPGPAPAGAPPPALPPCSLLPGPCEHPSRFPTPSPGPTCAIGWPSSLCHTLGPGPGQEVGLLTRAPRLDAGSPRRHDGAPTPSARVSGGASGRWGYYNGEAQTRRRGDSRRPSRARRLAGLASGEGRRPGPQAVCSGRMLTWWRGQEGPPHPPPGPPPTAVTRGLRLRHRSSGKGPRGPQSPAAPAVGRGHLLPPCSVRHGACSSAGWACAFREGPVGRGWAFAAGRRLSQLLRAAGGTGPETAGEGAGVAARPGHFTCGRSSLHLVPFSRVPNHCPSLMFLSPAVWRCGSRSWLAGRPHRPRAGVGGTPACRPRSQERHAGRGRGEVTLVQLRGDARAPHLGLGWARRQAPRG